MHKRTKLLSVVLAGAMLTAGACGDDDAETDTGGGTDTTEAGSSDGGEDTGGGELSGSVNVDGSSTVGPLAEVAAELFQNANSGVRVTVAMSGTSGGFEKFCIGETDMNSASREIKDSEIELCEENGIGYDNVQVANDALAIVINTENPTDCLTVDQANQIWDEGSTVSTWGEIDDLDAGDLADQTLSLYGPGEDSGTFDLFTEVINGEEGQIRSDYINIGEDDNAAVQGVLGDIGAMAFIPYSYFQENLDSVKPLQIDDGNGCVEATLENVQDGSYTPLGRPLFEYASDTALARPEVLAFMTFFVTESDEITSLAGFVPMTEEQKSDALDQVNALAGS